MWLSALYKPVAFVVATGFIVGLLLLCYPADAVWMSALLRAGPARWVVFSAVRANM